MLLGIEPDEPEPQYGWIEPGQLLANQCEPVRQVRRFWEKPHPVLAQHLMRMGCLWNSFVIMARLSTFLSLFLIALPELYNAFRSIESELGNAAEESRVQRLYNQIPPSNFSSEVLAKCPFNLAVLQVTGVLWSDLGESRRVIRVLAGQGILQGERFQFEPRAANVKGEGGASDL